LAGERLLAFRAPAAPPPEGGTPTVESDFGSPAVDEPGSTQLPAEPDSRAAREQKIHQALDAVVILHHDTAPLEQVICGLARQLRIPVYIDRPTLVEEVVSLDQPVTIHVHGISARSALALLLEPLHLASLVEDEMLMVTTAAAASEKLETRVYDVTDLVAWRDPNRANRFDFSRVTQLLQTTIDPVSWQNLSGPGSIMEFDSDDYRVLCIRQTQPIHQKIRELLAAIRKPRRKDREDVIHPITVRHEETPAARREATIRRALDKTVTIAAANRPLETVLQELAAQMRVPLFLDRVTFADEGIAIDRPVAIQELKITAHSALKLVLESSQLVAIVHNETLFVTSAAKAGEFVEPQVYDVYDLVRRFRGNNGFLQWDTQSLINAIDCTIEPDSWDICGPSAFPFRSADTCVLVIPQTQPIHEKIAAFLEELKRTMSK
jgi:hypothetical protein